MADGDQGYLVDVIGFNDEERKLLASIFGLAARRDPSFIQRPAESPDGADLYLVDADAKAAMSEYLAARVTRSAPAVLIGESDRNTGLPLLARPLQWARVLQAFDDAVQGEGANPEPMQSAKAALPRATGAGVAQPARATSTASGLRAPPDSVLVVDDNATVRKFMQARLAPFGFHVDFAESGEQAVKLTGAKAYTCVFLDVVLPGIDGYQVCKQIKGNKEVIKRTAVVMLTSRTSPFDKLRGSLAGCDEYLTKPVDENHLLEVIAKFLPSARAGA